MPRTTPKSVTGDNVLMTDGCGSQRFLTKPRDQHRIVADEIRQDHFDSVGRFEKDVSGLKDDSHAALAQVAARVGNAHRVMGSPSSDGVVASPSCGQWLTSSGKQRLQAGHSFIYRLGTKRNDGKKDSATTNLGNDSSRGLILAAAV